MKLHQLLKNKISSWRELEKQIEQLPTTKERGDVFEQFVFCYLGIKKNLYQIQCHYMAENIPTSTAWLLADLGEAKGKQELFTRQSPQRLKTLREYAMIESAVSSNRIEGIQVDRK